MAAEKENASSVNQEVLRLGRRGVLKLLIGTTFLTRGTNEIWHSLSLEGENRTGTGCLSEKRARASQSEPEEHASFELKQGVVETVVGVTTSSWAAINLLKADGLLEIQGGTQHSKKG